MKKSNWLKSMYWRQKLQWYKQTHMFKTSKLLKKFKFNPKKYPNSRGFFDLDGTLARFYDRVDCLEIMHEKGFYKNLGVHQKMLEFFLEFASIYGVENTYIISACIDSPFCMSEKYEWIEENIPIQLPKENIILVPCGVPKTDFVPGGVKSTDLLFDDYGENLKSWVEAGGTPVKAINPINNTTRTWTGYALLCD